MFEGEGPPYIKSQELGNVHKPLAPASFWNNK